MAFTKDQLGTILNKLTRKFIFHHVHLRTKVPEDLANVVTTNYISDRQKIAVPTLTRIGVAQDDVVLPMATAAAQTSEKENASDLEILDSVLLGSNGFRIGSYSVYSHVKQIDNLLTDLYNPRWFVEVESLPDTTTGYYTPDDKLTVKNVQVNVSDIVLPSALYTLIYTLMDAAEKQTRLGQSGFLDSNDIVKAARNGFKKYMGAATTGLLTSLSGQDFPNHKSELNINIHTLLKNIQGLLGEDRAYISGFISQIFQTVAQYDGNPMVDMFTRIGKFRTTIDPVNIKFELDANAGTWEIYYKGLDGQSNDVFYGLDVDQECIMSLLHAVSSDGVSSDVTKSVLTHIPTEIKHSYLPFITKYYDENIDKDIDDQFKVPLGDLLDEAPQTMFGPDNQLYANSISGESDAFLKQSTIESAGYTDNVMIPPYQLLSVSPNIEDDNGIIKMEAEDSKELVPISRGLLGWNSSGRYKPTKIQPINIDFAHAKDKKNFETIQSLDHIKSIKLTIPGFDNTKFPELAEDGPFLLSNSWREGETLRLLSVGEKTITTEGGDKKVNNIELMKLYQAQDDIELELEDMALPADPEDPEKIYIRIERQQTPKQYQSVSIQETTDEFAAIETAPGYNPNDEDFHASLDWDHYKLEKVQEVDVDEKNWPPWNDYTVYNDVGKVSYKHETWGTKYYNSQREGNKGKIPYGDLLGKWWKEDSGEQPEVTWVYKYSKNGKDSNRGLLYPKAVKDYLAGKPNGTKIWYHGDMEKDTGDIITVHPGLSQADFQLVYEKESVRLANETHLYLYEVQPYTNKKGVGANIVLLNDGPASVEIKTDFLNKKKIISEPRWLDFFFSEAFMPSPIATLGRWYVVHAENTKVIPVTTSEVIITKYIASAEISTHNKPKEEFIYEAMTRELERLTRSILVKEARLIKQDHSNRSKFRVRDEQIHIIDTKPMFDKVDGDKVVIPDTTVTPSVGGYAKLTYGALSSDYKNGRKLTGTVSQIVDTKAIVGTGTLFTQELRRGMYFLVGDPVGSEGFEKHQVESITDDTNLNIVSDSSFTLTDKNVYTNERIAFTPLLNVYHQSGDTKITTVNDDDTNASTNVPRTASDIMNAFISSHMVEDDARYISHVIGYSDDDIPSANANGNLTLSWNRAINTAMHLMHGDNKSTNDKSKGIHLLGGAFTNIEDTETQQEIDTPQKEDLDGFQYDPDAQDQTSIENNNLDKVSEWFDNTPEIDPVYSPITVTIGYDSLGNRLTVANAANGRAVQIYGVGDKQPVALNDSEITKRYNRRTEIWRECRAFDRGPKSIKTYADALNLHLIEPVDKDNHIPKDEFLQSVTPFISHYTLLMNNDGEEHQVPVMDDVDDPNYYKKIIKPDTLNNGVLDSERTNEYKDFLDIIYQLGTDATEYKSTKQGEDVKMPSYTKEEAPLPHFITHLFGSGSGEHSRKQGNLRMDSFAALANLYVNDSTNLKYESILMNDNSKYKPQDGNYSVTTYDAAGQDVTLTLNYTELKAELTEAAKLNCVIDDHKTAPSPAIGGSGKYKCPVAFTRITSAGLNDPRTIDLDAIKTEVSAEDINLTRLKSYRKISKGKSISDVAKMMEHFMLVANDMFKAISEPDFQDNFEFETTEVKAPVPAKFNIMFPSILYITYINNNLPCPFIEKLKSSESSDGLPSRILGAQLRWLQIDVYGVRRGLSYNPILHKKDGEGNTQVVDFDSTKMQLVANSTELKTYKVADYDTDSTPTVADLFHDESIDVTDNGMRVDSRFNKIPSVYSLRFNLLNRLYQPAAPFIIKERVDPDVFEKHTGKQIIALGDIMKPSIGISNSRYALTSAAAISNFG